MPKKQSFFIRSSAYIESFLKTREKSLKSWLDNYHSVTNFITKKYARALDLRYHTFRHTFKTKWPCAIAAILLQFNPNQTAIAQSPKRYIQLEGTQNPLHGVYETFQPVFVDLDGDSDLDFFAAYSGSQLEYFENDGSGGTNPYTSINFSSSPLAGIYIGKKPTFLDIDDDGDLDLFFGGEHSGGNNTVLKFYKNSGSNTNPSFGLISGNANPFNDVSFLGTTSNNYSLSQVHAEFIDIDGDGDQDVFFTHSQYARGVVYMENTGSASSPNFVERSGNDHPLNFVFNADDADLNFFDYDKDGDYDVFYMSEHGAEFFENTGTPNQPFFQRERNQHSPLDFLNNFRNIFLGGDMKLEFIDVDQDGKEELLVNPGDGGENGSILLKETNFDSRNVYVRKLDTPLNQLDQHDIIFSNFADLDGDGDFDMLGSARSGNVLYFENTGTSSQANLILQTGLNALLPNFNKDLPILEIADIDNDSDFDVIIGNSSGNIDLYENQSGNLTLISAGSSPFNGIQTTYSNSPTLIDLDNDGDLDLAVAGHQYSNYNNVGDIRYFENTGNSSSASFSEKYNNENPLHNVSLSKGGFLTFKDYDQDGDYDLIASQADGDFALFLNSGNSNSAIFNRFHSNVDPFRGLQPFQSTGFTKANFVDLDNDGQDEIITNSVHGRFAHLEAHEHTKLGRNEVSFGSKHLFIGGGEMNSPFYNISVTYEVAPEFADIDADGDLDAFNASNSSSGQLTMFQNMGNAHAPNFSSSANNFLNSLTFDEPIPSLTDIDNDGDQDLFVGQGNGHFQFFLNTGSNTVHNFVHTTGSGNPFDGISTPYRVKVHFADLDGDGDKDAILDQTSDNGGVPYHHIEDWINYEPPGGGNGGIDDLSDPIYKNSLRYYRNDGTASNPSFTHVTGSDNPLHAAEVNYYETISIADIDQDSDLDILVNGRYLDFSLIKNIGTTTNPSFVEVPEGFEIDPEIAYYSSALALVDLDKDGDADLLTSFYGSFYYYENEKDRSNDVPKFGRTHAHHVNENGDLWSWGKDEFGQLGTNIGGNTLLEAQMLSGSQGTDKISVGGHHSLAIHTSGTLYAWGHNNFGQLGSGNTLDIHTPTQIGSSNWEMVAAGDQHSLGIQSDGSLWSWGNNNFGQLGSGSTGGSNSTPTQVGSSTDWVYVSAGVDFSAALKSDGTVWTWGNNGFGQLGNGSTGGSNATPTQVGANTWLKIACGAHHVVALKNNNKVWTWGHNGFGQLAHGNTTHLAIPTKVNAEAWTNIAAGLHHSLFLKGDGSLWGAGRNDVGQLSSSSTSQYLSPAQINLDYDWKNITSGFSNSGGLKTNGLIHTWGASSKGQSGQNSDKWRVNSNPMHLHSLFDHRYESPIGGEGGEGPQN